MSIERHYNYWSDEEKLQFLELLNKKDKDILDKFVDSSDSKFCRTCQKVENVDGKYTCGSKFCGIIWIKIEECECFHNM